MHDDEELFRPNIQVIIPVDIEEKVNHRRTVGSKTYEALKLSIVIELVLSDFKSHEA